MHANNFFINLTIKLLNLNKKYKLYTITKLIINEDKKITTYIIINCNETNKEATKHIIQNITIKLRKNSVFFFFFFSFI